MGIAQRLAAAARVKHVAREPLVVSGKVRRVSVGNEYHPTAYRSRRAGEAVTVTLKPDQSNQYDPNAVALFLGEMLAGYLGQGPAKKYQPVIVKANALGYEVQTPAEVDTVAGAKALRLSLPSPEDLSKWLGLSPAQRSGGFAARS